MSPARRYVLMLSTFVVVAIAVRLVFGLPSGITLAALFIGWPLIGALVTIDDDFTGGWSNPDGTHVAEWMRLWWWADLLLVRGALVVLCFAIEAGVEGTWKLELWVTAVTMAGVGLPLFLRGVRKDQAHAA